MTLNRKRESNFKSQGPRKDRPKKTMLIYLNMFFYINIRLEEMQGLYRLTERDS